MDFKSLRQLSGPLLSAVTMEFFERLANFGMVMVLGIFGRFVNPDQTRTNEIEAI